jgi:hypothetical protein
MSAINLSPDAFEIHLEALLMLRLECHLWKAHFMHLAGREARHVSSHAYIDVWDLMLAEWIPAYTPERYERFRPLFDEAIKDMRLRLERLMNVCGNVLSLDSRPRRNRIARKTLRSPLQRHDPPLELTRPRRGQEVTGDGGFIKCSEDNAFGANAPSAGGVHSRRQAGLRTLLVLRQG